MKKITTTSVATVILAFLLPVIQAGAQNKTNTAANADKLNENTPQATDNTATNVTATKINPRVLHEKSALFEGKIAPKKQGFSSIDAKVKDMTEDILFQEKIGNYDCALEMIEEVLAIDPDHGSARFIKATILLKLKKYQESLDIFTVLTEEQPTSFSIKNNIAWVYATAKDIKIRNGQKALSLARDALMLAPEDPHIWNTLSESYYVSAEYDKSVKTAEISLQKAISKGYSRHQLQHMVEHLQKCKQAAITMSILD